MRTGKYTGKKQGATKAFSESLDNIYEKTGENPLQIFVDAIANSAQREEITRIRTTLYKTHIVQNGVGLGVRTLGIYQVLK